MQNYLEDQGGKCTKSSRQTVFLIGDSIRMGYCQTVKEELADVADVVYPEENCRFSQYILVSLRGWTNLCDPMQVKLVQFNCGHWDIAHWDGEDCPLNSIEQYQDNVRRIIRRLRLTFPNAKIVFATTTPMHPEGVVGVNPRTTQEIIAYNEAACGAARECGVEINDLFEQVKDWDASAFHDYCHYTPDAFAALGRQVAAFLRERL